MNDLGAVSAHDEDEKASSEPRSRQALLQQMPSDPIPSAYSCLRPELVMRERGSLQKSRTPGGSQQIATSCSKRWAGHMCRSDVVS